MYSCNMKMDSIQELQLGSMEPLVWIEEFTLPFPSPDCFDRTWTGFSCFEA